MLWLGTVVCWTDNHAGSAAWAQAIGSLLALGIAIFVPYKIQRQEKRRRRQQVRANERTRATLLRSPLSDLQEQIRDKRRRLAELAASERQLRGQVDATIGGVDDLMKLVKDSPGYYRIKTVRALAQLTENLEIYNENALAWTRGHVTRDDLLKLLDKCETSRCRFSMRLSGARK